MSLAFKRGMNLCKPLTGSSGGLSSLMAPGYHDWKPVFLGVDSPPPTPLCPPCSPLLCSYNTV